MKNKIINTIQIDNSVFNDNPLINIISYESEDSIFQIESITQKKILEACDTLIVIKNREEFDLSNEDILKMINWESLEEFNKSKEIQEEFNKSKEVQNKTYRSLVSDSLKAMQPCRETKVNRSFFAMKFVEREILEEFIKYKVPKNMDVNIYTTLKQMTIAEMLQKLINKFK